MTEKQFVTEITVTVKDESCRLTEKGIHYGPLLISDTSDAINHVIADALCKFGTHPESEAPDITVKTKTVWQ